MKVWIDVLTPKQARFFSAVIPILEKRGEEVVITTRKYREANQMLELLGIEARIVGEHGGGSLYGKLTASARRILGLAEFAMDEKPDVCLAFASVEASRVAFGLGIPLVLANNSPHSTAVAKLTVPLATKLLTPYFIPKEEWIRFGIREEDIIHYRAADEAAWLKRYKPNKRVLEELNLEERSYVVVRAEESFAAYLLGKVSDEEPIVGRVMEEFFKLAKEPPKMVVLTRYGKQGPVIKEKFGEKVIVPERVVEGLDLLYYAIAFVGAGGTMSYEAALMGVPTISCFPLPPPYTEKFLIERGLILRETKPSKVARLLLDIIERPEAYRKEKEAKRLLDEMEDPAIKIADVVEEVGKSVCSKPA